MGHSIINDAKCVAGIVPKVYFFKGNKSLDELPISKMKPIDLTTTVLSDADHGSQKQNPFKSKSSFSIEIELNDIPFKGYISPDVVDLCNLLLPCSAISRCVSFTIVDRLFNDALWMSRYLLHLDFNKRKNEEYIRCMARYKISLFDWLNSGMYLLDRDFREMGIKSLLYSGERNDGI